MLIQSYINVAIPCFSWNSQDGAICTLGQVLFWLASLIGNFSAAVFQDWDKPETIPDPDAKKPDDWDEDMDGEWEPPMIANPEYKVWAALLEVYRKSEEFLLKVFLLV